MTMLPGQNAMRTFPRTVGRYQDVTPFTERDGLTYLEVLARLRSWLENEFVSHLDAQVTEIFESAQKIVDTIHTVIDDAEAARDAAQAIREALEGLETRVEALATQVNEDKLAVAALVVDAEAEVTRVQGLLAELEAAIANGVVTITASVLAQLRWGLSNGTPTLDANARIPNTQLPLRIQKFEEMVIVGSSNALPAADSWTTLFAASQDMSERNFAVGGTGFTQGDSGNDNRYIDQLRKAADSAGFNNARVGIVVIADLGNDIRSENTTTAIGGAATAAFLFAKSAFPNARVILLPVCWGPASGSMNWNDLPAQWNRLNPITERVRSMAEGTDVEWAGDSWFWHFGDTAAMKPGEIHYTARGHAIIAAQLRRFMRGEATVSKSGPDFIEGRKRPDGTYAVSTNPFGDYPGLRIRRVDGECYIDGAIHLLDALAANTGVVATAPAQYRPKWPQELQARTGFSSVVLVIAPSGEIRLNMAGSAVGDTITVADSYRVD